MTYVSDRMANAAPTIHSAAIHPETLKILGGPAVVVSPPKAARGSARSVALRYRAVERLSELLRATPAQLLRLIDINERTAQRRKEQGTLTVEESDRLARIARVTQRAVDALGDTEQARDWLRRPNRALQGMEPLELLGTDAGAELVSDELGRIEYGDVY